MRKAENAKVEGGSVKVDALIRDGATGQDMWGLAGVLRSKEDDKEVFWLEIWDGVGPCWHFYFYFYLL